MFRTILLILLLVQHVFVPSIAAQAMTLPSGFVSELVLGGLNAPTAAHD